MLGHLDSAEINLKKAIEIYPENYSAFSSLGLVYFNRKEYQKAIDTFKKATDYKENVAESWYYSGMSYMNLGDYNAAVKQLEMASKHGRSIPEISFALAQAYEMIGSLQKSSDAYQVALSINPNYKDAWYNLAGVFTKMSRPQYAEECMKRYRALGGQ
jgi:tetratricopeptide (TPR) repeat protein